MKRLTKVIYSILFYIFLIPGLNAQSLSDTIDVVHYEINLDVINLSSKIIAGKTSVSVHPLQPLLQTITLELKQLQVDSVKNNSQQTLTFAHNGDRLHIILVQPVTSADTIDLTVYYHGIPFAESWGGFHFAGSYAFNLGVGFVSIPHNLGKAWFPCVDDFKDRALYDYHIRVENQNQAICGGLLQSITDNQDGTHTYFWHTNKTIPTYLASVAVGPYALKTDSFNGLQAEVPITYYVRPADTNKVNGTFLNLKNIASIYESKFGAYPFSRIGITGTALGAMEHAENIFYPHASITGNLSNEWLYAHELSHMWFGDKVTCATAADMWMNEGWARWCELIFTEFLYGQDAADAYLKPLLRDVLQTTHLQDDGYRALSPMSQEYTYGSTVYDKGAIVTHALRHYIGDSLFFPAVRDYLQTYGYNHATSYQLRDALSQSSGVDLTGFFDFFVFTPGFTHYSIDSFNVTPIRQNYLINLFIKQKLKGTQSYAHDCRVDVSFMKNDRSFETHQVQFSGMTDTASVVLDFIPVLATTDLYCHAGDATTDEAKTINSIGVYDYQFTFCKLDVKQVNDSAWVRVTHNWVAPDSMKTIQPGLSLSTSRYWTVEGIFPAGFNATGIFNYNKNVLDGDIITNSNDSLVMLYREDAGHDWRSVAFTRTGPWQLGFIYVNDIIPGQYTLAIWDELYTGYNHLPISDKYLKIFPNPTSDTFTIQNSFDHSAKIEIHKTDGSRVFTCNVNAGDQIKWSGTPGVYIVCLYNRKKLVAATKAIIK
jgi:aminopeptidase N